VTDEELHRLGHDARAELANIAGFVELTVQRGGATLDERTQQYLAHALAAVGRLTAVLDRLTAAS
jgi:hypothetical protein